LISTGIPNNFDGKQDWAFVKNKVFIEKEVPIEESMQPDKPAKETKEEE